MYSARSVFKRKTESTDAGNGNSEKFGDYEKIIALRISWEAYDLLRKVRVYEIETAGLAIILYTFHLLKNLIFRKIPKQWLVMNFELL